MCIVALLDETDFNVIYLDVALYHDATFFKKMGIILFLMSYKKNCLIKTLASNE